MINGQIWLKLSYDTACVLTSPDITQVIALADDTALASGDSTDVIADMLISHGSVVFTVGNLTLRISCDTTCVIDLFLLDCFFDLIGIDRKLTAVRILYSLIRSIDVTVIFTLFYRSVIIAGDSTGLIIACCDRIAFTATDHSAFFIGSGDSTDGFLTADHTMKLAIFNRSTIGSDDSTDLFFAAIRFYIAFYDQASYRSVCFDVTEQAKIGTGNGNIESTDHMAIALKIAGKYSNRLEITSI